MLGIVSMGKNSLNYYIELAREDYYLNGGEPPGIWVGRGAERLKLPHIVESDSFHRVFLGFAPDGETKLVQNAGSEKRHLGWDLTFSAPKSVSVLWSQSDATRRAKIEKAVLASARKSLRYLEDRAVFSRRGRGGQFIEKAEGLVAAMFLHATSRAQEPQIHVHCTVANLALRQDGTWGSMLGITSNNRSKDFTKSRLPIFKEKMAAGALFRAELAASLERDLQLPIRREGSGFEIDGVPRALMERFSTRRREIVDEMNTTGDKTQKGADKAALRTRARKAFVPRQELFRRWREQAAGFDLSALKRATTPRDQAKESEEALAGARSKLQEAKRPASKSQFVRRLAEESQGRGLDAAAVIAAIERIFTMPPRHPHNRDADRAVKAATKSIKRSARSRAHVLGSPNVFLAAKQVEFLRGRVLSRAERGALRQITKARGSMQVLPGELGSATTSVLTAARFAWERAGFKVIAASPSYTSKKFLQSETGIHSIALRGLLGGLTTNRGLMRGYDSALKKSWEAQGLRGFHSKVSFVKYAIKASGKWIRFDKKAVVILDNPEAISLHDLTDVMKHVRKAGAKLVFLSPSSSAHKNETSTEALSRILHAKQVGAELERVVRQQQREREPEPERTN